MVADRRPIEADWQDRGRCRDADTELFVGPVDVDDPPYPSDEAVWFCHRCEVRAECLEWALRYGLDGVWGGTSTYQRRQLRRGIDRASCPGCASTNVVGLVGAPSQVCIACGLSWSVRHPSG